jgi:hypothetical protein
MAESLTQRHRAQQLLLRRATDVAVGRAWPRLDFDRLDATYPALALDVSQIVERNRRTSAGLTAAYLREFRREQRVGGTPKIELVRSLNVDQFNVSLSTTSVASIKKATAEGRAADLAMRNALVLAQGAMARLVLNAGRDTLLASLAADSRAVGYERVLGGAGCEFCQMLAGRGDVYSAESADFEAHDHCGCTAEPVYRA